ncbi:MAG TPA: glucose 1-dehydrogenase [Nevskiaceae bacterium]|nr:glucose 1-dehydrogenase [Nevskiaceae bacterium]
MSAAAELDGRVALVTGGARGIGAGIARCFVERGARVAIVDVDEAGARETAAALGDRAVAIAADASDDVAMADAVERVEAAFGGLDILVNNAGGGRPGLGHGNPFTRVTQPDWDESVALNLRSAFAGAKAAIPALKRRNGGSIVNIASVAAQLPTPTAPAYAAAKAGVLSLTRTLALELAADGIRVNAICPGLLWTRAWDSLAAMIRSAVPRYADRSTHEIFLDRVKQSVPLGREQTPQDVGELAAFLCSARAANLTGQSIALDGGMTLRGG